MTEGQVELRRRVPWRFVLPAIAAVAVVAVIVSVMTTRGAKRHREAAVRQLLGVLDHDYEQCILGAAGSAELGKRIEIAGLTGQLTYERARACGELAYAARDKLTPLRDDEPDLSAFWNDDAINPGSPPGFGVCDHIEKARSLAEGFGVKSPPPGCVEAFKPLAATVEGDQKAQRMIVTDGELVEELLDTDLPSERYSVRRTREGTSWKTSPPLITTLPLVITKTAVLGVKRNEQVARYALLDGDSWHVGAKLADGGRTVQARRVGSGWTLLDEWDDSPYVVRLDDKLDRVIATTAIPALHGRWTWDAPRVGMIDDDGSVVAFAVKSDKRHVDLEAHRVPPGGTAMLSTEMKFDGVRPDAQAFRCLSYLVVPGVAVVGPDGSLFKALPGGDRVEATRVDCTADHLFAAGAHTFSSCDHDRCVTAPLPAMARESFKLDVSAHGQAARVLLLYREYAVMLDADPATAKLTFAKAWTWDTYLAFGAAFLIEGTWFTLPSASSPDF